MTTMMTTNGMHAWILAARPKTLSGAVAPVLVGMAAAYADHGFLWFPSLLCLLFALLMQVNANFVNDYVDFRNDRDQEDRLGPQRACAQRWITPTAMRSGILLFSILSCLCGLPLVLWGGWTMLLMGALCMLFCFLYSTTLSEKGLGDLLVLVFFGFIPVCVTYYLQTKGLTFDVVLLSLAMGLVIDSLLIVNNYRDINQDARNQKRTLAVMLGAKTTRWLYLFVGLLALAIALLVLLQNGKGWLTLILLPYAVVHLRNHRLLVTIGEGRELNRVLGLTGMAILLFALTLAIAIII